MRLLAIGYDEICWSEKFVFPPNELNADFKVEPNVEFQRWASNTFRVEIPNSTLEIMRHQAEIDERFRRRILPLVSAA